MARTELDVTSFDHDKLKSDLIDYLSSTEEFSNFDYEGSTINTIVDLLTRNSHKSAFLANMLANESFIDSAQKRGNVVSHATKLSYKPQSCTASQIVFDVDVTPANTSNIATSIVMESGTVFLSSIGGETYSFVTIEDYTLTLTNGTYSVSNVVAYQGQLITNSFVHSSNSKITIPNERIDTSTLKVSVNDSSSNDGQLTFNEATTIQELKSDSRLFFLTENHNGLFEIEFGRNIVGVEPAEGSVVTVTYVNTENTHANGVNNLITGTVIDGYANIDVSVNDPSFGGSDREDIERIRFLAPKSYQIQDRAVCEFDYVPLIKSEFSFIKSVKSWGGEKNNPPRYGTVQLSILSNEGGIITDTIKSNIKNFLDDYNVGSITPEINDPEYFYMNLDIQFRYDDRKTNSSFNELTTKVIDTCNQYNNEMLDDFDGDFNKSELNRRTLNIKGITSVVIEKRLYRDVDVLTYSDPIYQVNFRNPIVPGSLSAEGFLIDSQAEDHVLIDDGSGNVNIEFIKNGSTNSQNIGTVNYDTGEIEFSTNIINDINTIRMFVKTAYENFYVENNGVLEIDSITTSLMTSDATGGDS